MSNNASNLFSSVDWQGILESELQHIFSDSVNRIIDTTIPRNDTATTNVNTTTNATATTTTTTSTTVPPPSERANDISGNASTDPLADRPINRPVDSTVPLPPSTSNPSRNITYTNEMYASNLEALTDFTHSYNRNFREYQDNIRQLIPLYRNTQRMLRPDLIGAVRAVDPASRAPTYNHPITYTPTQPNPNVLFSYMVYPVDPARDASTSNILTDDQINRATRTYGYVNDNVNVSDASNVCPISLETFQPGDVVCEVLGCGHVFKRTSLMNWFQRDPRCPVCRYNLSEYTGPAEPATPSPSGSGSLQTSQDISGNHIPRIIQTSSITLPRTTTNIAPQMQTPSTESISQFLRSMMVDQSMNMVIDASGNPAYSFEIEFPITYM